MRVRFRCTVIGVLMDDGTERVFVKHDEVDLSVSECDRLQDRWDWPEPYDVGPEIGAPMDLQGRIEHCPMCKQLWRRRPDQKHVKRCRNCGVHPKQQMLHAS